MAAFRIPQIPRYAPGAWLLTVSLLLLTGCGSEEREDGGAQRPPAQVAVERVEPRTVPLQRDYAGRVHGAREVEVRARINGILEERLYREGEPVQAGDALFRIDRAPFEARLEEALAQRQLARAELEKAEREWRRIARLYERDAVSERERDSAESAHALAGAAVTAAQAQVTQARLQLDYTVVKAPVDGVTSMEAYPEGSLVDLGTLLTRIVQHDPVHVRFALPEDDAAIQRTARRARAASEGDDAAFRRTATLRLPDGSEYEHPGEIDFTASTIDHGTGSVSARAIFPNPDGAIIPGQFVRLDVVLDTLDEVFLVPERIVGEGPEGPQLFVVESEAARARPVELGPVTREGRVIRSGLEAGDLVVVSGHAGLFDGRPVAPTQASDAAGGANGNNSENAHHEEAR
ncbi:efflux transporter periplasmic adaptor subunit [Halorhodospira abdelmalekii]|uniref:efflux RND transporter periplasmic adaptor subunit n=1 Tax=Halorhodospira abdelmalekii TaxID=421629 RepID=UPI001906D4DD|nr:efflux RND transporter periplasmic adaptor subunit [Halorhodospira abdelmalekii]MBK1734556.1 efflux transporter periplasmic adaptor subunit [Halorhodospira abdelmalekii]